MVWLHCTDRSRTTEFTCVCMYGPVQQSYGISWCVIWDKNAERGVGEMSTKAISQVGVSGIPRDPRTVNDFYLLLEYACTYDKQFS